jgi:hypothetical protein
MKIAKKAVISLVIVAIFMASVITVNAISLGIAPSEISIKDALRGQEYKRFIAVYNYDNETSVFELGAEGEGKDWVTFCDEENRPLGKVEVPGSSSKKVFILFDIPENIPNGIYNFTVHAQTIPADVEKEGMVVSPVLKMPADVSIEVTGTQIMKGVVKDITIRDVEEGYPVRIKVLFHNTGNVAAEPDIRVNMTKDNVSVADSLSSNGSVTPGETKTISLEWDTEGRETGEYEADISVILGDDTLAEKEIKFNILPVGTLTREGKLLDLSYEGSPVVGRVLEINEVFKNTGEMDTYAKPNAKVYQDGDLLEVIEGEEKLIDVGTEVTLTCYVEIKEQGKYKLVGFVSYGGKETEKKELSFDVGEGEARKNNNLLIYTISAIVIISIIILLGLLIMRRRGKE